MFTKSQEDVNYAVDELIQRLIGTECTDATVMSNEIKEEDELNAYYSVLKTAQRRISAILTRRNDCSRINRVPEEVLVSILSLSLPSLYGLPTYTYYPSLKGLRRVCRLWTNLIDSCVMFWCFVPAGEQPGHLESIIRRSGEVPLIFDSQQVSHLEIFLKAVKPHFGRCKSLTITVNVGSEHLSAEALEASLVTLERLDFSYMALEPYPAANIFPTSSPPRLIEVILHNISGLRPCLWLSNLRFLSLQLMNPSTQSLLQVLGASPLLLDFRLLRSEGRDDEPSFDDGQVADGKMERIDLLHLKHFEAYTTPDRVAILLARVYAPQCRDLRLGFQFEAIDRDTQSVVAAHTNHLSTFLSNCHSFRSKRALCLSLNSFTLKGDGDSIIFGIYGPHRRPQRLSNYLPVLEALPTFIWESIVTLELDAYLKKCENLLHIMTRLASNISELVLPIAWGDRHDGLAELSRVVSAGENASGPKTWLLPNLNVLSIRDIRGFGYMDPRPESCTRLLRKVLNVAKARNRRKIDKSGQTILEARVDGVSTLQRLELDMALPNGGKKKVLLQETRRWMPNVIVQPPKPSPVFGGISPPAFDLAFGW